MPGDRDKLRDSVAQTMKRIEAWEAAFHPVTVGQLVSIQARLHGSKNAVDVFERNERATYEEVDLLSNRYARALRSFGVRKGDRVGVMLPNRIEFPLLWFALAKLGAILVPINIRYTPREIEYVLSDTQAGFVVVDESVWPAFASMDPWPEAITDSRVIVVGASLEGAGATLEGLVADADDAPVEEDVMLDDLLSINYTSGTTGLPKGAMLTHEFWSVSSYQSLYCDTIPLKSFLCAAPFFYTDALLIFMKCYHHGATYYLAPRMSSSRYIGWLKKYDIEWCGMPELIARQQEIAEAPPTSLKQVQHYGSWSHETMSWFHRHCDARGMDAYGMTEIGWGVQMPYEIEEMRNSGSLGLCSPFRALRLVNEDGSPTPVGEVGELWVKGRGLLKGYWGKPETNASSFEGDWFKTGDMMWRDELGFYRFVGRNKDMIRRSSENIAAREVEAIVLEMEQIKDVAAVPVHDVKRGEEVKIFIELQEGLTPQDVPVDRILEHARSRLAPYKVPRYIAFIDAFPRTETSHKILKRELMKQTDPLSGTYDSEEKRWR